MKGRSVAALDGAAPFRGAELGAGGALAGAAIPALLVVALPERLPTASPGTVGVGAARGTSGISTRGMATGRLPIAMRWSSSSEIKP